MLWPVCLLVELTPISLVGALFYLLASVSMEKAMAPHSGVLAWRIPGMEELGRLQWGRKESDTTESLSHKCDGDRLSAPWGGFSLLGFDVKASRLLSF